MINVNGERVTLEGNDFELKVDLIRILRLMAREEILDNEGFEFCAGIAFRDDETEEALTASDGILIADDTMDSIDTVSKRVVSDNDDTFSKLFRDLDI